MSRQTKILVLHMKELLYTAVFAVLGIILVIVLVVMFSAEHRQPSVETAAAYTAGVYTSSIDFQNRSVDVAVTVDKDRITDIALITPSDSITVMYPLMEPTIDRLREQILTQQSLTDISCESENQYTSAVLLQAIEQALQKAAPSD